MMLRSQKVRMASFWTSCSPRVTSTKAPGTWSLMPKPKSAAHCNPSTVSAMDLQKIIRNVTYLFKAEENRVKAQKQE